MWKKVDGIWQEVGKAKTADRPHPITIGLAFLSPTLAVVATVVSIWSLWEVKQDTKRLQRAYLTIKYVSNTVDSDFDPSGLVNVKYSVENMGGTPAYAIEVKQRFVKTIDKYREWSIAPIAPKNSYTNTFDIPFNPPNSQLVTVNIDYRDIFGEQHHTAVCWEFVFSTIQGPCINKWTKDDY